MSVGFSLNRGGGSTQEDSDEDLNLRLRAHQTTSYHGPSHEHPDDGQENHLCGAER